MSTRPPIRDSVLIAAAFGAVAVTVAVLRSIPGVNATTAGFALLILVQLAGTLGPLWIAITMAVASTLSFNFFFFPPVGTFSISEPHNWVALFAFLVTALIGSKLSAAAQERARMADARVQVIEEREAAEIQRQRGELASTLLASLSHDLKTPLTVLRMAIDHLRHDLPTEARHAHADAATAELLRLTRLFESILDLARIDAAAVQVTRDWVTPADIVDAALAHARHAVDGHALRVEADSDHVVDIDARVTAVALAHLLENAARYSPADREIVVDARCSDDQVSLSVTDHGPGLAAEEIDHLFERFYRGRDAQHMPGTGMGLAITRGLLTAIGGRVWADNVAGGGARFSMVVPCARRPVALAG